MFGSTSVLRTGQGDHVFVMTQLLLHSYPCTHTLMHLDYMMVTSATQMGRFRGMEMPILM